MQGRKNYSEKLFMSFQLSERIPKDNFYRRLRETLDLQSVYSDTRDLYGRTGNPSIDPVVFFKLMLVGYLENITSDRKLVDHCSMRMDILYFLGYDIDEQLPLHSTISRTRQLYPATIFESLFNKVFALCVDKGMVSGHTQALDSAPIKVNASMESLELKKPFQSIERHFEAVNTENQEPVITATPSTVGLITAPQHHLNRVKHVHDKLRQNPVGASGASHEKAQLFSNKTHYNPHDPDARISVKPGKARKLNYHCSMAVDSGQGVISHIQADYADGRDSQYLPAMTVQVQKRLKANDLRMTDLLADAGYSNGYNYEFLELRNITPWIPVFGKYKPEREWVTYNRRDDVFTCTMGKTIPFKGFDITSDGKPIKNYRALRGDCVPCVLKESCTPKSQFKRISTTAYEDYYHRAYERQLSRRGKRMKQTRQSTVEPVFGSLIHYYGLSKINVLGKSAAHKVVLMAATCFNLKKYLKTFKRKLTNSAAMDTMAHLIGAFLKPSIAFTSNF
ncbi:IS1182 family transposase [Dyadobacter chenhuakuii]|uniref:IS1182 family transposase n=1 Tax=Dyadobacter chenhuakuii TaxID=2909339 RepID=A0A9X1QJ21_9BACT|nr:IS1182 family transposase [Dyadobacter chenhuakuii]MCF2501372.1 IS1182 family transposase [Dyadobacter chenhuakuii]